MLAVCVRWFPESWLKLRSGSILDSHDSGIYGVKWSIVGMETVLNIALLMRIIGKGRPTACRRWKPGLRLANGMAS